MENGCSSKREMSAFVSSCGVQLTTNQSRSWRATTTVSKGQFARTARRVRCPPDEQHCAPQAPRAPMRMEGSSPPINAPSGLLLLTSSILAIASVGCVFELTGGHPMYGSTVTSGILAVSLPSFLFLFYSAIRKGQQEAEDDP